MSTNLDAALEVVIPLDVHQQVCASRDALGQGLRAALRMIRKENAWRSAEEQVLVRELRALIAEEGISE